MVQNARFSDSHLHLVEEGYGERYSDLDSARILMACTARPDEWDRQSKMTDPRIVGSYGVHPWYTDEWDDDVRKRLTSILESDDRAQVGEIGLDYKRGSVRDQMQAFEEQLGIASEMGRVATIHMVGTEKEVLESVRSHGNGCPGIILHSYGSDSYLKPFSELNCLFSISPRILSRSDVRVKRLMDAIPDDRLLLETDAPHAGKVFTGMYDFASRLGGIVGRDPEELLEIADTNLGRLIG
ncbi:MAG: TatD family hydrolase [Candidatus Methanomethylophilaceae archaeon]